MPQITHQYRLLRAQEKQHHNACLEMIAAAGETLRFGTLYLIDDGQMMKVGVAGQRQIAIRECNVQTGNPQLLRVVTLCFFYSREVAIIVETALKRRHASRRAPGGTEWFDVPHDELRRDVLAVAHEVALNQIRVTAAGAAPMRPEQAHYFYGLLMFDIIDGELSQSWDATPIAADHPEPPSPIDNQSQSKRDWWDRLLYMLGCRATEPPNDLASISMARGRIPAGSRPAIPWSRLRRS